MNCKSLILAMAVAGVASAADVPEEFRVRPEQVFEFVAKPTVTRNGQDFVISFQSRGNCDATVAIENANGRIVRHLASGVLGDNAPAPFAKGAKHQRLIWDGKNDQGRYIEDLSGYSVRVSLGLSPVFERTLFWSPYKRIGAGYGPHIGTMTNRPTPIIAASAEGVFIFEGYGVDHLRQFDHAGNYVRTIYPFPAKKLGEVVGLTWKQRPQDSTRLPLASGFLMSTLLTSGTTGREGPYGSVIFGAGAISIAAHGDKIALCQFRLNRLAADGTTGGLPLTGPATSIRTRIFGTNIGVGGQKDLDVGPTSIAFSPDGKWLYLAGFTWRDGVPGQSLSRGNLPGVARLAYARDEAMSPFLGSFKSGEVGRDEKHFRGVTSVACDGHGRVYVSDFLNDRVQVFAPDGRFLKSIAVNKPARVAVHARTGEIYVFSWAVHNHGADYEAMVEVPPTLTRFGPFDKPTKIAAYPLPIAGKDLLPVWHRGSQWGGLQVEAVLDSWVDPTTIWLVSVASGGWNGVRPQGFSDQFDNKNIRVLAVTDGGLKTVRDFGREVNRQVIRSTPPGHQRQRLYVNPANGNLYIGEGNSGYWDAFYELIEVDPRTGRQRLVQLPFDAEDLAFDINGLGYLRTNALVGRFDPADGWREVPFDYGEERVNVGWDRSAGRGRKTDLAGALPIPVPPYVCEWHLGGFDVNVRGQILIACLTHKQAPQAIVTRSDARLAIGRPAAGYVPRLYPGRPRQSEYHVWDERGKLAVEDAVPGLAMTEGVGLDHEGNIYVLATDPRVLPDGRPYFVGKSGTLMKFKPHKARFRMLKGAFVPVPLPPDEKPDRRPDLRGEAFGPIWVDGAEWFYGGVGWWGWNAVNEGGGCSCWNARFDLDYFARSFGPELDHYSVAVLDSAGNLITRIGAYGNVDDGGPQVADGGPTKPRSIGGDEVALFRPAYVATHTDHRLFIADAGNARILSVKLNYRATERIRISEQ